MANTTELSWEDEPRDPGSWPYSDASRVYGKLKNSVEGLYKSNKALWDETGAHLNDAYANANDTVMENKKDRPSQKYWDDALKGSLSFTLASADDVSKKALAHWEKHGIKP